MKTQSDRASGGYVNRARRLLLEERERLAYITGDLGTAKLLGELLDAQQAGAALQRPDDQGVLMLAP